MKTLIVTLDKNVVGYCRIGAMQDATVVYVTRDDLGNPSYYLYKPNQSSPEKITHDKLTKLFADIGE
jgi:hypothetical protein